MAEGVTISERRVDWLTCFARTGESADALEEYTLSAMAAEIDAGNREGVFGFQGFVGQSAGHIQCGRRADGVLTRIGGGSASNHVHNVLPLATHVSRLDICTTIYDPSDTVRWADLIWQTKEAQGPGNTRGPKCTRTEEMWGGYTTYIGRRSSAVMARVYDKHAESKGDYAKGSWRFELELKKHASEQEASRLLADPHREDESPRIIAEQFKRWGLLVPWDTGSDIELWRTPARVSDLDKTARQLGNQYGKTAKRYVARYGLARFLALFGLDEQTMNEGD